MTDDHDPLDDDDVLLTAREVPIATRSAAEVERAAERFVTSTRERAGRRQVRAGWRSKLAPVLLVIVGAGMFVVGRVTAGIGGQGPAVAASAAARPGPDPRAAPAEARERVNAA